MHSKPAIAAMHGPHSVFDTGHCTIISILVTVRLYTVARTLFSILVTVWLYTVMTEVCHWLTNEKQRKTDIRLTDQLLDLSSNR